MCRIVHVMHRSCHGYRPSFPHIQTEACDTPAHRQTEAQRFAYDGATKRISLLPAPHAAGGAAAQCLTIGQVCPRERTELASPLSLPLASSPAPPRELTR